MFDAAKNRIYLGADTTLDLRISEKITTKGISRNSGVIMIDVRRLREKALSAYFLLSPISLLPPFPTPPENFSLRGGKQEASNDEAESFVGAFRL